MLPNLSGLAKLVDLSDDTGPKAEKAKPGVGKTPYTKPPKPPKPENPPPTILKEFDADDLPPHKYPDGKIVKTVKLDLKSATEAERGWLRINYGQNWSEAAEPLKTRIKEQARRVLALEFAPKIILAKEEEEAAATKQFDDDNFTENGSPKLDWATEVLPVLQAKYPPPLDWRKNTGTWLTQAEKDARAEEAKASLRGAKMAVLSEQRGVYVAERAQLKVVQVIEELNYPDASKKRKARALLRHWFNRKGRADKEGITARVWNKPGEDNEEDSDKKPKKKVAGDVPPQMHKQRMIWAKDQVGPGYDPSNPPQPPANLYLPLDIQPLPAEYLPDEVKEISAAGGQWLWTYMRSLEAMAIPGGLIEATVPYTLNLVPVDTSAQYWEPAFRAAQMAMLKDSYEEFITSVDEMSEVPNAKNTAHNYTVGSGKFNKYLLYKAPEGDPTKIPAYGSGAGGVAGDAGSGQIGPPDLLHRLYKLINRCPRLPEPAIFLRAGRSWRDQPHNLGKASPITPKVGRGYLNVTFMSTSSATPDNYTNTVLSMFYNNGGPDGGCCMFAITCPANSPVLPLVLGGHDASAHVNEQEVVLPPGLVLVYQGQKRMKVGKKEPMINFYQAELPPKP